MAYTAPGSLYLAAFEQVTPRHVAIVLSVNNKSGYMAHARYVNERWVYEFRILEYNRSHFLSILLKIHDASAGVITPEQLKKITSTVPIPAEKESCFTWAFRAVQALHDHSLVALPSLDKLIEEFNTFAQENAFVGLKYPSIVVSAHCS